MKNEIDNKIPTTMSITIATAQDAIEYWLQHVLFKPDVKVSRVGFSDRDNVFNIEFYRTVKEESTNHPRK